MRRMYDENQIKEIAGAASGGKLYRHNIKITGTTAPYSLSYAYLTVISSSNLKVDSLTDLKTLLGNVFEYSATGYNETYSCQVSKVTETGIISHTASGDKELSFANMTVITDTITTI